MCFFGAGGGRLSFLFQVHLLIFLGLPFVFIPGALFNPTWTLGPPARCHLLPILFWWLGGFPY